MFNSIDANLAMDEMRYDCYSDAVAGGSCEAAVSACSLCHVTVIQMQSLQAGPAKPLSPRAQLPKRFVPTYHGDSNTVAIQLFCIDEKYEMRSV